MSRHHESSWRSPERSDALLSSSVLNCDTHCSTLVCALGPREGNFGVTGRITSSWHVEDIVDLGVKGELELSVQRSRDIYREMKIVSRDIQVDLPRLPLHPPPLAAFAITWLILVYAFVIS
jgi:hypothetical protein